MKSILFLILIILLSNCTNNIEETSIIKKEFDTIIYSNGYSIVCNNKNELIKVFNHRNLDSTIISFYNEQFKVETSNSLKSKRYYFSTDNGLYKIKQYLTTKKLSGYQNQIVYIDTLSDNFSINNSSSYLQIQGLKDTFMLNKSTEFRFYLTGYPFQNFKLVIKKPNSTLDFDTTNIVYSNDFNNDSVFIYNSKFSEVGTNYFQGYIENYSILDSERSSIVVFFRKRIFVK